MKFPSKEQVERIRAQYPVGTWVAVVSMVDPYTDMPADTTGVITGVDDTGTVFAEWSNGSSLGAVYGEDVIRKLTRGEIIQAQTRAIAQSGQSNMFDCASVQRLALDAGYRELVDFIETDRKAYAGLILTGELPDE